MNEERPKELRLRIVERGDPEAIEALVVLLGPWVKAICRGMGLEEAGREDAMQEFFVKLWDDDWRALRVWGGEASLRGYLRVIARRIALDVQERRGVLASDVDRELVAPGPGPRQAAESGESRRMLFVAMSRLSDPDSQVLTMRILQDLPHDEIARRLGITTNAASVRLHRAERRLEDGLRAIAREEPTWN